LNKLLSILPFDLKITFWLFN